MISQWWSVTPAAVWWVGCLLKDRGKTVPGLFLMSMSGLGWMVYGVLRNETVIWVMGALVASTYYLEIAKLARTPNAGTLDGEDKVHRQE